MHTVLTLSVGTLKSALAHCNIVTGHFRVVCSYEYHCCDVVELDQVTDCSIHNNVIWVRCALISVFSNYPFSRVLIHGGLCQNLAGLRIESDCT